MTQFFNIAALYNAIVSNDYQYAGTTGSKNTQNMEYFFKRPAPKKPTAPIPDKLNIPGLSVESPDKPYNPITTNTANAGKRPSKTSKMRATAKDIELLKKHNASLDKNDPNANAQFVDGNVDVYISAANCRVPTEGDTLDSPEFIKITDNTNGHHHKYYYYKLTPELGDGKHFAKFGKNMPIDTSQFEEGQTYYILGMAVDEESHTRLDLTDHIEIYRLDFSYDADNDTCNYDLIQDEKLQGSGQSSIDYDKRGV